MILAGSPVSCIRRASAACSSDNAFGLPIDSPRARRASLAAERRIELVQLFLDRLVVAISHCVHLRGSSVRWMVFFLIYSWRSSQL
jgi:hypothetical protein